MNETPQSEVFFLISSVGFVMLWTMLAVFLFYLTRATKIFYRILAKMEQDINKIGDTSKEMLEDMKDSSVYQFLFHKKKKGKKE